jgi:Zn-dependent protease with chaperone function
MSSVEKILEIAEELGKKDMVVILLPDHPEASALDAMGGAGYTFWTRYIILSQRAMEGFTDKEVRFIIAHESGHARYKLQHERITMKGRWIGPKATLREKVRLELEADRHAVGLLGGGCKSVAIFTIFKACSRVITYYPARVRPVLWVKQLFCQILPRVINIILV